jgi:hypothetical protein
MEVGAQSVERLLCTFMAASVRVCQEVGQCHGLRWHIHLAMHHDQVVDDPPMLSFSTIQHMFHHNLEGRVSGMCLAEFVDQVIDDPPMFPFFTVEHLFHHSLEGRVSGMCLAEFIEDGERRG